MENDFFHKDVNKHGIEENKSQKADHAESLHYHEWDVQVGFNDGVITIVITTPKCIKQIALQSGHNVSLNINLHLLDVFLNH